MSPPINPPFQPGEIAVLRHESGARLFTVKRCWSKGSAQQREKIWMVAEETWQPQYGHEVSASRLIKVKDRDQAIQLVTILVYIHDTHRRKIYDLEVERDRSCDNIIEQMRHFETEE